MAPGSINVLVRLRCFWLFLARCPPLVCRRGFLAASEPSPVGVVGLLRPLLLPLLDVRVLTGGASIGLCCGFGFVGDVDSDELLCRLVEVEPSGRVDLSLDFFELPPNSRLKKPGLLSSLLDMPRDWFPDFRSRAQLWRTRTTSVIVLKFSEKNTTKNTVFYFLHIPRVCPPCKLMCRTTTFRPIRELLSINRKYNVSAVCVFVRFCFSFQNKKNCCGHFGAFKIQSYARSLR